MKYCANIILGECMWMLPWWRQSYVVVGDHFR